MQVYAMTSTYDYNHVIDAKNDTYIPFVVKPIMEAYGTHPQLGPETKPLVWESGGRLMMLKHI